MHWANLLLMSLLLLSLVAPATHALGALDPGSDSAAGFEA
jgi:hypothetical protein